MIIMLEGIDGCGKTTQAKELVKYYQGQDRPAEYFREPGSTPLGELLRPVVLNEDLQPWASFLLFQAMRIEFETAVLAWLRSKGDDAVAVIDRGWPSTVVYQSQTLGLENVLNAIAIIDKNRPIRMVPDLIMILHCGVDECRNRLRDKKSDKYENRGKEWFENIEKAYWDSVGEAAKFFGVEDSVHHILLHSLSIFEATRDIIFSIRARSAT